MSEAIALLRDFASDTILLKQLGEAWINAVAALDSAEARQLLLSFVDPEILGLPAGVTFERDDVLAVRLAELGRRNGMIAQRQLQLCMLELPPTKRNLLAQVLGLLGTTDATLAGLNLIDDAAVPPVPYEIWKQLEATFVEHKSVSPDSNAYRCAPRSANHIRNKLWEMTMKDERRKKAAYSLLGQIEMWRLEYGRPIGEPHNPDVECKGSWPLL
jgi:hypothetical protein